MLTMAATNTANQFTARNCNPTLQPRARSPQHNEPNKPLRNESRSNSSRRGTCRTSGWAQTDGVAEADGPVVGQFETVGPQACQGRSGGEQQREQATDSGYRVDLDAETASAHDERRPMSCRSRWGGSALQSLRWTTCSPF